MGNKRHAVDSIDLLAYADANLRALRITTSFHISFEKLHVHDAKSPQERDFINIFKTR